jgi:PAS domain S-box-containing protein
MERKRIDQTLEAENRELRARLQDAEEALRAISNREVDAFIVGGPEGPEVFTLQGAEQPYRVFIETMNEGAVTITPDGIILYCNARFAEMLERTPNSCAGTSFFDLVAPESRGPFRSMIGQCGIEGCKGEFLLGASDRKQVPVYLSVTLVTGDSERFSLVITDLTELKQAEEALRRANENLESKVKKRTAALRVELEERKRAEDALRKVHEELEIRVQERTAELKEALTKLQTEITERGRLEEQLRQAQKMEALGTLTGGIAHDFNNILAAILGFTEMSLDDVPPGSLLEKNLTYILNSSFRARDLIRQMLTFSRKTEYERKSLPLSPLLKETVKLLRASIPTTVQIDVTITATSDTILGNATGIQQIVMNLAANASDAMQEKGGKLTIALTDADIEPGLRQTGLPPGEYLQLIVQDRGTGMDAEVMKRMFEPFFTTKGAGRGTGMGLAMVYGIVKSLGGSITVESMPGEGSTFRVFLPKAGTGEAPEIPEPGKVPGGTEHILFIDDEENLAELGKAMLEKLGYKVTAMTDSAEALRVYCENPSRFDLVITDQTMPGLSGISLARELLKVRPDMPIILCTGHSETVNQESIKAAGIREYLMKPLARQELAETVRRVLDTRGKG